MPNAANSPTLTNTLITVTRTPDGGGNVSGGKYNVAYGTAAVSAQTRNEVLTYQLADPTPPEIRFTGVSVAGEGTSRQMSTPTISRDGRMLTLIDADTAAVTMNLTFKWKDCTEFEHDPQVGNVPPP